ncbi:MAG: ROK family protein [Fimbriimonadales bacterium]
MSHRWGIDLGGTKIEGVVLPEGSVEPLCRMRVATEADRGYEHIVSRIVALVEQMEAETGIARPARIGVGTPGAAEPSTGRMKNCNSTALNGQPLPADLSASLGVEAVVANDANCFALAEATLGAAKDAEVVFGVIMGTGVGGGIVVHGRVLGGAQGIAGEWGHNVLDPEGDPCYCGRRGCVETVLSGPSLERFYFRISGERRRLPEIVARRGSDPHADATMERLFAKFGEALGVVVNILDPDVVVLGGGVGNIADLRTRGRDELAKHVFNPELRTQLRAPTLGDSAGVFGAAMLVA